MATEHRLTITRKTRGTRDPEASRAAILQAALREFSDVGYDGARVDRIARAAGVSKPLLYDYFGDKDGLYAAALREAYLHIRRGEAMLDLESLSVEDAVRRLVLFTMTHFYKNPWFLRMLNTENLRGGETVSRLGDRRDIQSPLFAKLGALLDRGRAAGQFRTDVDAVTLYLFIASLCYFPVSNRYTLEAVFGVDGSDKGLETHARRAADLILSWLTR